MDALPDESAANATLLERTRELARGALSALERNRTRINDLNVYPVPDGDTGTNMTLTVRAIVEALEQTQTDDRETLAREVTRAALMGSRGNSGVIFSQILRGFAEIAGSVDRLDAGALARAFRSASDTAYDAVDEPVEGTMLTVIRELAEEAERHTDGSPVEALHAVVARGEDAVARTRETLDELRRAGVVDAGGAALLEIIRAIAAIAAGEPLPEAVEPEELGSDAIHQELSTFRYCTIFVVEGEALDADVLKVRLAPLGDSLLVVGDSSALKIHVHTDDPGSALSAASAIGVLERIEIANMHAQTLQREDRLGRPAAEASIAASAVVAVVAGKGNRALFENLGAAELVEGGQSMNPAASEIVAAVERADAPEVIVIPNNPNVILAAKQAAKLVSKAVHVIETRSIPAGLSALVSFDSARSAAENVSDMEATLAGVATGAVAVASRDAEVNGLHVHKGEYLGLYEGEPLVADVSFDAAARAVVERLLSGSRSTLMLVTGEQEPDVQKLVAALEQAHPDVELEVHSGGQPHYPLLLGAE